MALWAFRFLLWYICILIVHPQNRFPILYPLRIANVCALAAIGLHVASCLVEKRPILRAGPATIIGILLLTAATLSRLIGTMQTTTDGGAYYDMLYKNVIIMVLLEAIAAGLPIITTDCGWVPRLVAHGGGLVVPLRDPGALAAALARLGADPHVRKEMGTYNRAQAVARWRWEASASKLNDVYISLLRK